MNNTKQAIFITLYRVLEKGKKRYIIPSVDAVIELLTKRHDTTIKRRWAFQCLHDLEAFGYITRRVRYVKNPDGGYKQIPSIISFTLKGARKLYSCGIESAARLAKEILGWLRGGDKRFPEYKSELPATSTKPTTGGFMPLSEIYAALGVPQK